MTTGIFLNMAYSLYYQAVKTQARLDGRDGQPGRRAKRYVTDTDYPDNDVWRSLWTA